ncbi:protein kinase domain-containing protein [Nocardiopsis potens]|uniref:protein kinase domain-containing protein n=1 Tax=Nocardiopsis potens TaxID=1246458 RepID=UPI00034A745B|nr:protein kinase [Nocardiopsis potens]
MADPLRDGDPARVGPYRLHARLGGGGMGEVFLGASPGGRTVAVKTVRPELAGDADFRRRFAAEVEAARRVGGFYTAQVVDADPGADPPWLATAYIPGPSLHQAVSGRGPLPPGPAAVLGAGLAEGLAAVHAQRLVHRDLKPGNVILASDGPRLIDFGIARATDSLTYTSPQPVIGTAPFMSPEQAEGGEVAPASDVFSLGCVLAFAATGRSPFGGGSAPSVLYRIVHADPDLAGLPAPLAEAVAACLAKEPADRPAPQALVEELAALAPPGRGRTGRGWLPEDLTEVIDLHETRLLELPETKADPGRKKEKKDAVDREPRAKSGKGAREQRPRSGEREKAVRAAAWGETAKKHRGRLGRTFTYVLPPGGRPGHGRVWGDGVYSENSSVGLAAVHAGLITLAGGGRVTIEIRSGLKTYAVADRNGITGSRGGSSAGSFVFPGHGSPGGRGPGRPEKEKESGGQGMWTALGAAAVALFLYANVHPAAAVVGPVLNGGTDSIEAGDCVGDIGTETPENVELPCIAANARHTVLGRVSALGSYTEGGGFRHGCADVPGWTEGRDGVLVVGEQMVCVEDND